MEKIIRYAVLFRHAIEKALEAGAFNNDKQFSGFPSGCCGEASDLLAQYLLNKWFEIRYVCGTYRGNTVDDRQSHAWLIVDDNTIVDITGDQFKWNSDFYNYDKSVYVGEVDDFHRLFEVEDRDVREHYGIDGLGCFDTTRLWDLYRKILKYI